MCSCSYGPNRIQPFRLQTRQGRELAQEERARQDLACLGNRSTERRKVAFAAGERQDQARCPERRTASQCSIAQAKALKKIAVTKGHCDSCRHTRTRRAGRHEWPVGVSPIMVSPPVMGYALPFSLSQDSIRQNCGCCIMST